MIVADIRFTAELENELSRPSEADVACMGRLGGDLEAGPDQP